MPSTSTNTSTTPKDPAAPARKRGRPGSVNKTAKPAEGGAATDASAAGAAAAATPKKAIGKRALRLRQKKNYDVYLARVFKTHCPGMRISYRALAMMVNMMQIQMEAINLKAQRITRHCDVSTLTANHVAGAVQLHLTGALAKHAVSEATKAIESLDKENNILKAAKAAKAAAAAPPAASAAVEVSA